MRGATAGALLASLGALLLLPGAASAAELRVGAQLRLDFQGICGFGTAASGPGGACEVCAGCGVYADEAGLAACKVANCSAGSVRVFARKATSASYVCKEVRPGSSFVADPATSCFTVAQCEGAAVYQDEPGQGSCKRLACSGALPLARYASGVSSADASALCAGVIVPKGSVRETREGLDEVRVCAGCGAYSDAANASVCKIATAADCPAGMFPKVAFGATSPAEACSALPAGAFYDAGQCAARKCTATLNILDGLGCADVNKFEIAHGVCGAADFPGSSPQDVLAQCQALQARCGVLRVSAANVRTIDLLSQLGASSDLEPWCKSDEPHPQCSCPAPTGGPTRPTASPKPPSSNPPSASEAGLVIGGVGSTMGPSDAPAALVPASLVSLLLATALAL